MVQTRNQWRQWRDDGFCADCSQHSSQSSQQSNYSDHGFDYNEDRGEDNNYNAGGYRDNDRCRRHRLSDQSPYSEIVQTYRRRKAR